MKSIHSVAILGTFSLGIFAAWALPSDWFISIIQICAAIGFILAILTSIDAKGNEPSPVAIKIISYLTLGTSRPTSTLESTTVLKLFQLIASYLVGALIGMIILGFK